MLLLPSYNEQYMCLSYICCTHSMVYESFSTSVTCYIFNYMESIPWGIMALHIDYQNILYYYMDTYNSIMMGHSYFQSSD